MPKLSDASQDSYVTQGLALGVLNAGVTWIPADKLAMEFALSHAWRSFPAASRFYRVGSDRRADPYYLLAKSERRRGPLLAAWSSEKRGWEPYVWNDGWTVSESGEMLADWSQTPWSEWQTLGVRFVDHYRKRGLI